MLPSLVLRLSLIGAVVASPAPPSSPVPPASPLRPATAAAPDRFTELFRRGLEVERSLASIRASFTETTVSSLLVDPIVARGTLLAAAPGRVRMEYETPERKTVIISGGRLAVAWPGRARREVLDIGRTRRAVDRYFTAASEAELRRFFEIEVREEPGEDDLFHIVMRPRRRPIREGLEGLDVWVERKGLLVRRMKMSFPDGDSKTVLLERIETNVPLDGHAFAIPGD